MGSDTTAPPQLGNYDIVSKIAEGGMGTVYKASTATPARSSPSRSSPPHMAKNPVLLKRFEQEFRPPARSTTRTSSGRSTTATAARTPFLVMEFVDGESLGQRIERDGRDARGRGDPDHRPGVRRGCTAPTSRGSIHRDVKPDNILVTRDGVAKLTDLGLVKDVGGRPEPDQDRPRPGHAALHGPGAVPQRQERRRPLRHLLRSARRSTPMVTGELPFEQRRPARLLDEEDPATSSRRRASWTRRCPSAWTGPSAGR